MDENNQNSLLGKLTFLMMLCIVLVLGYIPVELIQPIYTRIDRPPLLKKDNR